LATNQNSDGSFGSGDADYKIAQTAEAVLAFENEGHFPDGGTAYSENVEKGLDYIFGYAHNMATVGVTGQPDVDANGNGIGVYFSYNIHRSMYNTGIVMTAIVGSNTPARVVTTGSQAGRTYQDVMIDTVDYVAFGQNDAGTATGGWRYYANYGGSDNSVSQWPVLGLIAAEQWGIIAPAFVKDDLNIWIDYIQNDVSGGSGYDSPTYWVNVAKTGALLIEQYYVGDTKETPRVIAAVNYINTNWAVDNKGNYYAMYGAFKGLELLDIGTIPLPDGTFDWHDDYSTYLVNNQLGDGSWPTSTYGSIVLDTDWAILILQGTVFPIEITVDVMESDCGAFMASVPVEVDYSVERFPVNGKLEIFEDGDLIVQVDLENFIGTATYTNTFVSDGVGEHTYKAVLTVTTLEDPPVTVSAEDSTTVKVYEGPAIGDIPDQTAPFTPFDLDDYLLLPDPFFPDYTVDWTASEPGNDWTVGMDLENVVTVAAPDGANDPKTITFTATTTVTCGEGTSIVRNSDDATFIPNQPPDVSEAYPSLNCLWAPNHDFIDITIEGVTDPDGDEVMITITGITSDEPTSLYDGEGNEDLAPDASGVQTDTASLRAERSGTGETGKDNMEFGNGRVYEITFVASDGNGGEAEGSVTVCVPHELQGKCDCSGVIDDGQIYDATQIN
jgi:hypothetical protein